MTHLVNAKNDGKWSMAVQSCQMCAFNNAMNHANTVLPLIDYHVNLSGTAMIGSFGTMVLCAIRICKGRKEQSPDRYRCAYNNIYRLMGKQTVNPIVHSKLAFECICRHSLWMTAPELCKCTRCTRHTQLSWRIHRNRIAGSAITMHSSVQQAAPCCFGLWQTVSLG